MQIQIKSKPGNDSNAASTNLAESADSCLHHCPEVLVGCFTKWGMRWEGGHSPPSEMFAVCPPVPPALALYGDNQLSAASHVPMLVQIDSLPVQTLNYTLSHSTTEPDHYVVE